MKRITIIGGGASGTLLAINLLRYKGSERVEINIVEKREKVGRGVAFGTEHDVHLLNVPAGKMSAFPDEPGHFLRWLNKDGPNFESNSFVPRKYFADYLTTTLEDSEGNAVPNVVLNIYDGEAISIDLDSERAEINTAEGDTFYSEGVVLAFGNFPPPHPTVDDLAFTEAPKYFREAWSPRVEELIRIDDSVLVIGTGLSMADAVMQLEKHGHRGKITAISTRGILPAVHKLGFSYPDFYDELRGKKKITDLFRTVQGHMEHAASNGSDWRAVIDSLRPHTQQLWLDLPLAEKRYFMQHLSRYWNAARHRMPAETATVVDSLQKAGQLEILRGRLRSIKYSDRFEIEYRCNGEMRSIRTDAVVNCIGPESNFAKVESSLVRNLLDKGLIRCDALNFGLDAMTNGNLLSADGKPSPVLYTLGTALKGILWESTAIPEIRSQARSLGELLLPESIPEKSFA
jgi:uncharacterized NAD(P)/FAD-binding protein YdhS